MKTDSQKWASLFRVAIVGATTLKGKELKQVLDERNFPAMDIKLLDDDESLGQLDQVQDEVAFIQPVTAAQLERMDFTFFASNEKFTRKNWKLARNAGSAIVDLSYALESEIDAPVRAPWIDRELGRHAPLDLESTVIEVAHPAAIALALLLLRALKAAPIRSVVATLLEPVTESGKQGMDELHEQTINLLSFQPMPTRVFGSQIAFNVIDRFGEGSAGALESIQHRIAAHLARLLEGRVPVPSLMLLQAPVFHAHTFSIYLEFEKSVALGDFTQALAGEHVEIARSAEDSPSNVNVAGKDEVLVSVRRDAARENGFWLWAAVDNLRLVAATAVECATALAAVRPHGKVQ
ncbi:MAG TPA: Asd/ArgC dimerization domain-containing protein [Candidatus Saccharimonadales bacterium]|jgi:aspartate-semialdehyde dehydrogenase|nr:Asd/ArgC dimerization domain-containing protein [Candidatus Saccharimonadales bacterium]